MSQAKPNASRLLESDLPRLRLYPGDVLVEQDPRNGLPHTVLLPPEALNRTERSSRCGTVVAVGSANCEHCDGCGEVFRICDGANMKCPECDGTGDGVVAVGDFVYFNRRAAEGFTAGTKSYVLLTEREPDANRRGAIYAIKVLNCDVGFTLQPMPGRIIVKRDPPEQGVIIIPDAKRKRSMCGTVLASRANNAQPGDRVLFHEFAGNTGNYPQPDLIVLEDDDVLAVLKEDDELSEDDIAILLPMLQDHND